MSLLKVLDRHRGNVQPPRGIALGGKNLFRVLLVIIGLAAMAYALASPGLRGDDGLPSWEAWLLVLGGMGAGAVGVALGTTWQKFALLLSLSLLGQGAALGLVYAPSFNILQHYLTWPEILSLPRGWLLIGPVSQTLLGVWVGWQHRVTVLSALRRTVSSFQLLIVGALLVVAASNASFDIAKYAGELALAVWVLTANAVVLVTLAGSVPQEALGRMNAWFQQRLGSDTGRDKPTLLSWDRLLPWVVAIWVVVFAATVSWVILERVPHIPDGVSHLFQAKYLSTGQLYLPSPPDAAAFDFEKFHNDGVRWFAYAFPGWPVVLSLGVLAKAPWLVNPVLAGVAVLLTHALVSRLYNRSLAHVVALLLAVSPWFIFMSASFMSHPATIVWTLIALLAVANARDSRRWLWGAVAGGALGALFLTRPQEALMVGLAIGIWLLFPKPSVKWRSLAAMAAGGILVAGLIFPYNRALTGDPLLTPHQVMTDARYYPGADRLGFGSEVGTYGWRHLDPLAGHGPADVAINAHMNFYMSNFELFGWGFGSVVFVALLLLLKRAQRTDWLFLLIIGSVVAGHSFFWFSGGPDFGARYWYQLLIPLVILTARGIQVLRGRWIERNGTPSGAARVAIFVAIASLVAMLTFVPWRALEKYPDYRGMNADLARLSQEYDFEQSVVFVTVQEPRDYARALILNPPTLNSSGTIYAQDLGPESRATVMSHYPGRKVWRIEAIEAGGSYTILSEPSSTSR